MELFTLLIFIQSPVMGVTIFRDIYAASYPVLILIFDFLPNPVFDRLFYRLVSIQKWLVEPRVELGIFGLILLKIISHCDWGSNLRTFNPKPPTNCQAYNTPQQVEI